MVCINPIGLYAGFQVSCPVVPSHTPSDVNRSGQLILQSMANPGIEGKLTIIAEYLSVRHLIVQLSQILCVYVCHTFDSNVRNGCCLVPWTACSLIEDMDAIGSSNYQQRC